MDYKDIYSLSELESMPTISSGHSDDLKVDTGTVRVWLSRMTVADGAPYDNQVTVEEFIDGVWKITKTYQAR